MLILPPDIIDKLDSTSKEDGLSANQGRLIDLRVQNLETSSAKFKGNFATPTDLQTAFPSPQVGDYAYVISTSSQWVESSGVWLDTEKDLKDNFLNKNNNLSELINTTTARTNLSVYSTTEVDTALSNNATADRNRTNHTGTQTASTISDFQSTVSSNADVSANTSARHTHSNKTILDNITASYTTAEQTKLAGIQDGAEVNIQANWTETNNTLDSYIQNKPTLATVATSGDHADLSNKGTNTHAQIDSALSSLSSNKADKVTGAVAGNIAQLDASGNLVDSGIPKTELHQNRAIWGYQDFIAGSITSVNVTLTTNQNGTSAPFNILNITGTGFIVRSDDLEEYAYTGTSKLFSSKVKINSITNDAVVLSGVPHSSYPIRIYYQIIASYFPSNYKMPPAILSASALDKLDPIIATQTELDTGLSSKEPTITNLPYTKGGTGLNTLTGQALKTIRVKSTEDGYEFITNTSSAVWGAITGTLSSQTDLQNALNSKLDKIVGTNTNYLSKWDASNNLVKASLFEDASGNVGIGNTSYAYRLSVARQSDGIVGYFRRDGATINPALTISANETGNTVGFGTDYAGATSPAMTFSTQASERMRIDSNGNVAIGFGGVDPAHKLAISGGTTGQTTFLQSFSGTTHNFGTAIGIGFNPEDRSYGTRIKGGLVYEGIGIGYGLGDFHFLQRSTQDATPADLSNAVMTIKNNGNVGIGTTQPSGVLGLARGSGASAMIEIAGNGNTPGISSMLVGQDAGSSGYCWNRASGAALLFGTDNTERMRITSSGNVGIGTAMPDSKLHVQSAVGSVAASFSDAVTYTLAIARSGSTGNVGMLYGTVGSSLALGANNAERMRIDSSGNVGIGTGTPAYRLSLNSPGTGTGITLSANGLPVQISRGGLFNYYYENSNYVFDMYNYENGGYIRFGTEATERMRIDSSGDLFIYKYAGGGDTSLRIDNNGRIYRGA